MAQLFPTFDVPEVSVPSANNLPEYPVSYKYDFENSDFVIDGAGRLVEISGHEAWVQWCVMSVMTERFEALVFDASMGVDYDGMKQQPNRETRQAWLEREITEALLVDPRTESVRDFTFTWPGDAVYVGFIAVPVVGTSEKVEVKLSA